MSENNEQHGLPDPDNLSDPIVELRECVNLAANAGNTLSAAERESLDAAISLASRSACYDIFVDQTTTGIVDPAKVEEVDKLHQQVLSLMGESEYKAAVARRCEELKEQRSEMTEQSSTA